MCRYIIHFWRSLFNCLLRTSGWHPLLLHHHWNWIWKRSTYFVLDISNDFWNTMITNTAEIVYLNLPHLYLMWLKRKFPNHPLASVNKKYLCIQSIKSIQGTEPAGKFWYDLLKSIFISVKMTRSSSDHGSTWITKNSLLLKHMTSSWQDMIVFYLKDYFSDLILSLNIPSKKYQT